MSAWSAPLEAYNTKRPKGDWTAVRFALVWTGPACSLRVALRAFPSVLVSETRHYLSAQKCHSAGINYKRCGAHGRRVGDVGDETRCTFTAPSGPRFLRDRRFPDARPPRLPPPSPQPRASPNGLSLNAPVCSK